MSPISVPPVSWEYDTPNLPVRQDEVATLLPVAEVRTAPPRPTEPVRHAFAVALVGAALAGALLALGVGAILLSTTWLRPVGGP